MSAPLEQVGELFDLFEYFATNHGLILTNEELLEILSKTKTE